MDGISYASYFIYFGKIFGGILKNLRFVFLLLLSKVLPYKPISTVKKMRGKVNKIKKITFDQIILN